MLREKGPSMNLSKAICLACAALLTRTWHLPGYIRECKLPVPDHSNQGHAPQEVGLEEIQSPDRAPVPLAGKRHPYSAVQLVSDTKRLTMTCKIA